MDNLNELRQKIKLKLAFERKLNSPNDYKIIQFFLTLTWLNEKYKKYSTETRPRSAYNGVNQARSDTFYEYLEKQISSSRNSSTYESAVKPTTDTSISLMEKCLSQWSNIVPLYKHVRKEMALSDCSTLSHIDKEPSILTVAKVLEPSDYSFVENTGIDAIEKPKISILPLSHIWRFYNEDCKEFCLVGCSYLIVLLLSAIGIWANHQPFTWIGALIIGVSISFAFWFIVDTIHSFIRKRYSDLASAFFCITGVVAGAVFFFAFYSVQPSERVRNGDPNLESVSKSRVVYITPNGACYHKKRTCPSLSRSRNVMPTSYEEVSGRYRPCQRCIGE